METAPDVSIETRMKYSWTILNRKKNQRKSNQGVHLLKFLDLSSSIKPILKDVEGGIISCHRDKEAIDMWFFGCTAKDPRKRDNERSIPKKGMKGIGEKWR